MNKNEIGRQVICELMGEEFLLKKDSQKNDFNSVIHEYAEEVCFGGVWAREGIDKKTRSIELLKKC